jgi:hypothetical protein
MMKRGTCPFGVASRHCCATQVWFGALVLLEPDQRPLAAVTADDGLNLRAAPSTQAAIVRTLERGSVLCVREPLDAARPKFGAAGFWLPVCARDGACGFVWSEFVALVA